MQFKRINIYYYIDYRLKRKSVVQLMQGIYKTYYISNTKQ